MSAETATDADAMNKPMSHATQSAILSKFPWTDDGRIRVTCTHRTEELLKKAGIREPKALQEYDLSVRREESGLLVLNPFRVVPPVSVNDDELFEVGGLFAGQGKPVAVAANAADSARAEKADVETNELSEFLATRTFTVSLDSHFKVRVQMTGFRDNALPSPGEQERWVPAKASDAEVRSTAAAFALPQRLVDIEQI